MREPRQQAGVSIAVPSCNPVSLTGAWARTMGCGPARSVAHRSLLRESVNSCLSSQPHYEVHYNDVTCIDRNSNAPVDFRGN